MEFAEAAREQLNRLIREFGSQINGELQQPWEAQQGFRAWALAQTTLAVHGLHEIDRVKLQRTLLGLANTECACWHEFPHTPPHVGASSWVVYSLGNAGALPEWVSPDFLLKTQKLDGLVAAASGNRQHVECVDLRHRMGGAGARSVRDEPACGA